VLQSDRLRVERILCEIDNGGRTTAELADDAVLADFLGHCCHCVLKRQKKNENEWDAGSDDLLADILNRRSGPKLAKILARGLEIAVTTPITGS
jgi:hypothetical protein